MEEAAPERATVAARSRASLNKALFVANLLNPAMHNNCVYRTGSELCPGKRATEWATGKLARAGYAVIVRTRLARLKAESQPGSILKEECTSRDADESARYGYLEVVRALREYDMHCTADGANMAAMYNQLHVVRDLRANGIHCTTDGADYAAEHGYLDVIRDLREHGIHCTPDGADLAAQEGHLDIVRDLRAHGIHCTEDGANGAADNGYDDVLEDLAAHGIFPSGG